MGRGGILDLNSLGNSASRPAWYTSRERVPGTHRLQTVAKKIALPVLEVAEGNPMVCIREHGKKRRRSS